MISVTELRSRAQGGRVVFDRTGDLVRWAVPAVEGPAILLVSEMTDALKSVEEGRITGSIDRARVWVVDAIVLDAEVLDILEGDYTAEDLIGAVREAGFEWRVSPTSGP